MAPVQGEGMWWPLPKGDPRAEGARPPGLIEWEEHERAWEAYAKKYGTQQSAERIAERGGFGYNELKYLLGHAPETWRPR